MADSRCPSRAQPHSCSASSPIRTRRRFRRNSASRTPRRRSPDRRPPEADDPEPCAVTGHVAAATMAATTLTTMRRLRAGMMLACDQDSVLSRLDGESALLRRFDPLRITVRDRHLTHRSRNPCPESVIDDPQGAAQDWKRSVLRSRVDPHLSLHSPGLFLKLIERIVPAAAGPNPPTASDSRARTSSLEERGVTTRFVARRARGAAVCRATVGPAAQACSAPTHRCSKRSRRHHRTADRRADPATPAAVNAAPTSSDGRRRRSLSAARQRSFGLVDRRAGASWRSCVSTPATKAVDSLDPDAHAGVPSRHAASTGQPEAHRSTSGPDAANAQRSPASVAAPTAITGSNAAGQSTAPA